MPSFGRASSLAGLLACPGLTIVTHNELQSADVRVCVRCDVTLRDTRADVTLRLSTWFRITSSKRRSTPSSASSLGQRRSGGRQVDRTPHGHEDLVSSGDVDQGALSHPFEQPDGSEVSLRPSIAKPGPSSKQAE